MTSHLHLQQQSRGTPITSSAFAAHAQAQDPSRHESATDAAAQRTGIEGSAVSLAPINEGTTYALGCGGTGSSPAALRAFESELRRAKA